MVMWIYPKYVFVKKLGLNNYKTVNTFLSTRSVFKQWVYFEKSLLELYRIRVISVKLSLELIYFITKSWFLAGTKTVLVLSKDCCM